MIDGGFIRTLYESDDPLMAVWAEMTRACAVEVAPEDLRSWYDEREEALNRLERAVYEGYFEAYDELLRVATSNAGRWAEELLDHCPLVIIADSLSVREVGLLAARWKPAGWQIRVEGNGFAVAPFPPMTSSLSRVLLNAEGPSAGRDTPRFTYRYVAGPEQIPNLATRGRSIVWVRLPDTALEDVKMAQTHTMAEAFQKAEETLLSVLVKSGRREAIITSDHGYLYACSPSQYWAMPSSVEDAARTIFSRESRMRPLEDEAARRLKDHESPYVEQRYFASGSRYIAMRGRYWWGTDSPNDRCTSHGGLSFVECLVPVLRVIRVT